MKQHKHTLHTTFVFSSAFVGAGLLCLAAAGPVRAQVAPGEESSGSQTNPAGADNSMMNPKLDNSADARGEGDASSQDGGEPMQQAYKDYSQKKFSAAVSELQAVLKKSPNILEAHEMLADIYRRQNQLPQAIPEMEAVVRLKPKDASWRDALGGAYLQTGDYTKAADVFQAALAQSPASADDASKYAYALEKEGRHTDAAAAFEKAAALDPKDSRDALNAGLLYHDAGNDAKAVPELKSALALGTADKYDANLYLAEAADAAKQPDDAIGYYKQAVQAKPDDFAAEANLGVVEQNAGKKADAEASYRQALTLKTNNASFFAGIQENLAGLLKSDGSFDEAATLLTQAAQVDTHNAAIQVQLGAIYQKQGKKDLALAAYNKALAINPNSAVAKDGVAQTSKP